MGTKRFHRLSLLSTVSLLFFLLWLGLGSEAMARAGGGRSSGGRGFSAGRSYQPSQRPAPAPQRDYQQSRPQPSASPTGTGRSFFSGLAGGLVGGMLGGLLFRSLGLAGSGWGGGEGGGFGFGDTLLLLVILAVIYYVVKRFRSRGTMQMSAAGAGPIPYSYGEPPLSPSDPLPPVREEGLKHIRESDPSFDEGRFQDLAQDIFFKIQSAWGKRDLSPVRHLLTPEMFGTFQQEMDRLRAEGRINRLENVSVRQVEITEAGQDRGEEFITVKIYANLLDYAVDEKSGQVLSGSTTDPVKFREFWTFSRPVGERNWALAGITQEGDH
ncbi:MAG: Tim44 domain-containing protein [Deltaproteobacteria bacterium]|nr:Tim44 domain-containing protein [Deltaproteobacteria bacterium]